MSSNIPAKIKLSTLGLRTNRSYESPGTDRQDLVYSVPTASQRLYGYEPLTGEQVATVVGQDEAVDGPSWRAVAKDEDAVYAWGSGGVVRRWNYSTFEESYESSVGGSGIPSMDELGDFLYIHTDGELLKVRKSDGSVADSISLPSGPGNFQSLRAETHGVYLVTYAGPSAAYARAYDSNTLSSKWDYHETDLPSPRPVTLAVGGTSVYVGFEADEPTGDTVRQLDISGGSVKNTKSFGIYRAFFNFNAGAGGVTVPVNEGDASNPTYFLEEADLSERWKVENSTTATLLVDYEYAYGVPGGGFRRYDVENGDTVVSNNSGWDYTTFTKGREFEDTETSATARDVRNLSTPSNVSVGESVTISADVENLAGTETAFTVALIVNVERVKNKEITLSAGQTGTVEFSYSFEREGNYQVAVETAGPETVRVTPGGLS